MLCDVADVVEMLGCQSEGCKLDVKSNDSANRKSSLFFFFFLQYGSTAGCVVTL